MKIECNKKEFAAILKACYVGNEVGDKCEHCALCPICTDLELEDPLVDMCEVSDE